MQQQHEQQHVEQDPLMGFCRNMRCMQLEAGHAGMQALERGKRGLRDRAVWRARQGVLHRSGSGVVDARGTGRNTRHSFLPVRVFSYRYTYGVTVLFGTALFMELAAE